MFLRTLCIRTFLLRSGIKCLGIMALLMFCSPLFAQLDSVQRIREVVVTATPMPHISQTVTPVQVFDKNTIQQFNVLQLSDVVKHFTGVTVKDYGGVGGLKTVSIRGLGATHTGVSYDGVMMGDIQNGQVDLGRMNLSNVDEVALANGGNADCLQSARAMAAGGLLTVQSMKPKLDSLHQMRANASLTAGSFGLLHPAIVLQNRLSGKLLSSVIADYQYTNGRYPFDFQNGNVLEHYKRTNSDVKTFHGEANLYYQPVVGREWTFKGYAYTSTRGLPGAVILYNPLATAGQRLWENDYFMQLQYKVALSSTTQWKTSLKADYSDTRYVDPYFLNSTGGLDDRYYQQEYYLTSSLFKKISDRMNVSAALDAQLNHLTSNMTDFPAPTRFTGYGHITGRYTSATFKAECSLLATTLTEHVEQGPAANGHNRLSPLVSVAWLPLKDDRLQLRGFYKETFRMPTFNDLYYRSIGNKDLKPETARQWNAGISYMKKTPDGYLALSLDGYYNRVTNKIIAVPAKDLFEWSMLNLGLVETTGTDVSARGGYNCFRSLHLTMDVSYTYQHAVDKSNPANSSYGQLIAYSPEHSGVATIGVLTPLVNGSVNCIFSGYRYDLSHSVIDGYAETSVAFWRSFESRHFTTDVKLEVLNLTDEQYVVVKNYPMPGRSWRVSVGVKF
ncbi:TonB-dependent receptor [Paludibacter sp.]|uniref:TonB-dependent receptor plug domain-containing protein n=1 Tax=Paludibacter sp. TaxID=1898105 RepID=UPI001354757D|nr:TonB-dependent receptor [Paludibacter sp.]MTK53549.1 TonB-dependent receptor [Paludibacter sp.]